MIFLHFAYSFQGTRRKAGIDLIKVDAPGGRSDHFDPFGFGSLLRDQVSMPQPNVTLATLAPDVLELIAEYILAGSAPTAMRSLMSAILSCRGFAYVSGGHLYPKPRQVLKTWQTIVCHFTFNNAFSDIW